MHPLEDNRLFILAVLCACGLLTAPSAEAHDELEWLDQPEVRELLRQKATVETLTQKLAQTQDPHLKRELFYLLMYLHSPGERLETVLGWPGVNEVFQGGRIHVADPPVPYNGPPVFADPNLGAYFQFTPELPPGHGSSMFIAIPRWLKKEDLEAIVSAPTRGRGLTVEAVRIVDYREVKRRQAPKMETPKPPKKTSPLAPGRDSKS
ncbi:MAG: hypothetical protein AAGK14_01335 [Verrucomicrobiota bacterium]